MQPEKASNENSEFNHFLLSSALTYKPRITRAGKQVNSKNTLVPNNFLEDLRTAFRSSGWYVSMGIHSATARKTFILCSWSCSSACAKPFMAGRWVVSWVLMVSFMSLIITRAARLIIKSYSCRATQLIMRCTYSRDSIRHATLLGNSPSIFLKILNSSPPWAPINGSHIVGAGGYWH